jgi:hypothetical protein
LKLHDDACHSFHAGLFNAAVSTGSFRKRLPVAAKIALVTAGTTAEVPAHGPVLEPRRALQHGQNLPALVVVAIGPGKTDIEQRGVGNLCHVVLAEQVGLKGSEPATGTRKQPFQRALHVRHVDVAAW